jgi:DoxX-like family
MQSRIKNLYWTFTLLFIVPMIASGIGYSAAVPPIAKGMAQLGFPFYLIRFLGAAKLLGAVAILSDKSPRLKEWAYAGFTFNLVGAAYSHLCSGEGPKALIPLVILSFAIFSYRYWNQLASPKIAMGSFPSGHSIELRSEGSRSKIRKSASPSADLSL